MSLTKHWYQSKIFWGGILICALAGFEVYQNNCNKIFLAIAIIGAAIAAFRLSTIEKLTK